VKPLPAEPSLVVDVDVYYYDTDAGGVVHNVAYLRMIEMARSRLAEHLGWSLADMRDSGRVPVVARTEIDYLKPARLADKLEIHSRLGRMSRVRFELDFEIRRPADGVMIAKCRQVMVTVQLPGLRPQPVPSEWETAYPQLKTYG
jgi:acyl-CoA thioester hydrolase